MRGAVLLLAFAIVACEASPAAPLPSDAGSPPPALDEPSSLEAKAAVTGLAADWRLAADALARADRRPQAVLAYEACAKAAEDDFETALYCQAAAAVARKIKPRATP